MTFIKEFVKKHPSAWRYVSISVIIAVIFPTFFVGYFAGDAGKYFALAVYLLIAIVGSYEVIRNLHVRKWYALIIALLVSVVFFYPTRTFDLAAITGPLGGDSVARMVRAAIDWKALLIIFFIPFLLLLDPKMGLTSKSITEVAIASITMLMIAIFAKFIWIVNINDYVQLFYFLPIAVIADSFAYFGGKYLRQYILDGKKLAPKLSPKKTWAGFFVGYVFSALFIGIAGWQMNIFGGLPNGTAILVLLTFILPIVSALGDLFFSGIKRYLEIKDFSNLMPGHGGIMDRIDAMSAVIVVIFLVFVIVI